MVLRFGDALGILRVSNAGRDAISRAVSREESARVDLADRTGEAGGAAVCVRAALRRPFVPRSPTRTPHG